MPIRNRSKTLQINEVVESTQNKIKRKTLSIAESSQGSISKFKENLRLLIATTLTAFQFHSEILQSIETNAEICNGQEYCPQAVWLPPNIRSELGRQSLSWTSWFSNHTMMGRTLMQLVTIRGCVANSTEMIAYLLKMRGILTYARLSNTT